jgi:hypothetical protein
VIDVLAYPAPQLLDVTGPVQVFASANDLVVNAGGAPPYRLKVVALDTLLVAGGEGAEAAAENPMLVDWVRQRANRVALFAPAHSCSLLRAYWTAAAPRPTGSTALSWPSAFLPCISSPIRSSYATVRSGLRPG